MNTSEIILSLIVIVTVIFSYKGFNDPAFFNQYQFETDKILIEKDYKRLFTSSLLHLSWLHLILNMLSLYIFGEALIQYLGVLPFVIIYVLSAVGGDLLSLYIHRNQGDYSSAGASGAINGLIFAFIALFPNTSLHFFLIPIFIPAWLFGLIYVGISIYGIKSQKGNVGHDAHLGGALIGIITAIIFHPQALQSNFVTILLITLPILLFLYLIYKKPEFLILDNSFSFKKEKKYYDVDDQYNEEKVNRQNELDALLDKIGRSGINSLSQKEKQRLKDLSK